MANQYRSVLSGSAGTGGDAVASEVLSGKTFTNDNGPQTGTMTNNGAVSQTIGAGESYTIPEGFHNGSGTVTASSPSVTQRATNTANNTTSVSASYTFTEAKTASILLVGSWYSGMTLSATLNGNSILSDLSQISATFNGSIYAGSISVNSNDVLQVTVSGGTSTSYLTAEIDEIV